MTQAIPLPHYDIPRAGRALAALIRNPDDLPQVFTLIESMSGTAPHRMIAGFERTDGGARIMRERPDIVPLLADRDALRALPEGTLGRVYLEFVESEGISPQGIRDASDAGMAIDARPESFKYLHQRMRDTHDLWHAATGYKGDVLGELSLLAFTLGQNWNAGIAMIVVAGLIKGFGSGKSSMVWQAYRRGRSAEWLPSQDWESLLAMPVEEVRTRLRVGAPVEYEPIRTADLRAQGIVAA